MRASALLALGCAALGRADDVASPAEVERPTFTPYSVKAPFFEQFENDKRWKRSTAKKENTEEEWQYVGTWANEEASVMPAIIGDKGLVLKDRAAHHAISAKFDKPVNNKDKTLVVQYEIKFQHNLECGGAYLKLLQDNKKLKSEEFSNASPYIIMFGPDRCGSTNRVHFIFRHKNPKTGEYEEKHMRESPTVPLQKTTQLYTLVVRPDQTFEIFIDGVVARSGTLLESFKPAVNPSKEIDDPKDTKPEDWVDDKQIDDPESVKPEDWDEDAPYEILDEEAEKPEDWLENEPLMVPDPEASKPEDWDDEEDGDWQAPMVPNPKCDEVSGCGPWAKPMKLNPDYKGKWVSPRIENPAYKGEWAPKKITNPDYFQDETPSNFEPMGAIGFELWTMQEDIYFDNIYVGHSMEQAQEIKAATWDIKHEIETAIEEAQKAKEPEAGSEDATVPPTTATFADNPVKFVQDKIALFVNIAKRDPIEAAKSVPEVAGGLAVALIGVVAAISSMFSAGAPAAPAVPENIKAKAQQAKDAATKAKNQAAEAVTTGAEKARDEVNKRTTRSGN